VQTLVRPLAVAGVEPYASRLKAALDEIVQMFEPQEINIAVTGGEARGMENIRSPLRTHGLDRRLALTLELGQGPVADHHELTIRSGSAACGPIKNRSAGLSVRRWVCVNEASCRPRVGPFEPSRRGSTWCVDAPIPDVARIGRVLERHSNRWSSTITVLTAHKERVRKLGVDRAISTMSGRVRAARI
jgi:predicted NBD/HSP70 family sugar kinase